MKPVSKFVIDRSIWMRGDGNGKLLDSKGQRCCVGIYLKACGISDTKMLAIGTANSLVFRYRDTRPGEHVPKWLLKSVPAISSDAVTASEDAEKLYSVNDSIGFSEEKREQEVKEHFAKNGIKVSFKGGPRKSKKRAVKQESDKG